MDKQPKRQTCEGPLRIDIKHSLSDCFPREVKRRAGEGMREEEGRQAGRQAGRLEESGRAAREGDEEIREMES